MVDENSKASDRNDQELYPETVMVPIICCPELGIDQVDCGIGAPNVDHLVNNSWLLKAAEEIFPTVGERLVRSYLHECIVQGDERGEQIQVSCGEHNSKQNLALSRDTFNKNIRQRTPLVSRYINTSLLIEQ